jgi:hypothetical protein
MAAISQSAGEDAKTNRLLLLKREWRGLGAAGEKMDGSRLFCGTDRSGQISLFTGLPLAVARVLCQPFSAGKFPVKQGKYREFSRLRPDQGQQTPKRAGSIRAFWPNSLRNGTGILIAEQGNISADQGIFRPNQRKLSFEPLAGESDFHDCRSFEQAQERNKFLPR